MPRKVILGFGISLDGYIARRNGAIDFLVIDKEGEALMADFFAKIDTTIMGRKTAAAMDENAQERRDARHAGHGQLRNLAAMEAGQTRGIRSGERISDSLREKAKTPPRERHLLWAVAANWAAVSCKRIWWTNSSSALVPYC